MKLLSVLAAVFMLAGCASGRLFDGEATDKDHASLLVTDGVSVAFIRPAHADISTEKQIFQAAIGGVWVSGGTYTLRYSCDLPNEVTLNPKHDREQTLHVEPGYRFGIYCNTDGSVYLKNIGDEYVEYGSYMEAAYAVSQRVRRYGQTDGGEFFHYEYYNDWAGNGDIQFWIRPDYSTHVLTAQLELYSVSVLIAAEDAYIGGVRSSKEMDKQIAPKRYVADVQSCPKLQDYNAKLHSQFKERLNNPRPGSGMMISTDSPDIYRYYIGDGPDAMLSLYLQEDKGTLYQTTLEAMDYVKTCGKLADKPRF